MFVKDTSERITMDDIRMHPWVVGEYGTPPLRLEPQGAVEQLNATDSKVCGHEALSSFACVDVMINNEHVQVEHLKGIVYEQDALLYSFHEVTSSRDIHRPHKNNIGPVNSFEINRRYVICCLHRFLTPAHPWAACRSHSHDSDLDVQAGIRLTIPRPLNDPAPDRETLGLALAPAVTTMDAHLSQLAQHLNLAGVPAAPSHV